ncbi:uncharacterized protein LTR77_002077 [Saxophila tyrrhenica]|uniref:Uncharacterized protein n=1 Tax=Saxophila tyrrhenica TaxID=1690608 RepID=A0AAV9PM48_9PEZI|nr:hypothetical protein LTR77_002077 [Saxophila tyrrhenica]
MARTNKQASTQSGPLRRGRSANTNSTLERRLSDPEDILRQAKREARAATAKPKGKAAGRGRRKASRSTQAKASTASSPSKEPTRQGSQGSATNAQSPTSAVSQQATAEPRTTEQSPSRQTSPQQSPTTPGPPQRTRRQSSLQQSPRTPAASQQSHSPTSSQQSPGLIRPRQESLALPLVPQTTPQSSPTTTGPVAQTPPQQSPSSQASPSLSPPGAPRKPSGQRPNPQPPLQSPTPGANRWPGLSFAPSLQRQAARTPPQQSTSSQASRSLSPPRAPRKPYQWPNAQPSPQSPTPGANLSSSPSSEPQESGQQGPMEQTPPQSSDGQASRSLSPPRAPRKGQQGRLNLQYDTSEASQDSPTRGRGIAQPGHQDVGSSESASDSKSSSASAGKRERDASDEDSAFEKRQKKEPASEPDKTAEPSTGDQIGLGISTSESSCEQLERRLKTYRQNPPSQQQGYQDPVGAYGESMIDEDVFRCIAAVSEATGCFASMSDLTMRVPPTDEVPANLFIARPTRKALVSWTTQERSGGRFPAPSHTHVELLHRDSANTHSHRGNGLQPSRHASEVRRRLVNAGWVGGDIHPTEREDTTVARQSRSWTCCVHTIYNAWAYVLDLELSPRPVEPSRYMDFIMRGQELLRLSVQGLVDSQLIWAFFDCYGFIQPNQTIPADRRFDDSVPFLNEEAVRAHANRIRLRDQIRDMRRDGELPPGFPDFETALSLPDSLEGQIMPLSALTVEHLLARHALQESLGASSQRETSFPPDDMQKAIRNSLADATTQQTNTDATQGERESTVDSTEALNQAIALSMEQESTMQREVSDDTADQATTEPTSTSGLPDTAPCNNSQGSASEQVRSPPAPVASSPPRPSTSGSLGSVPRVASKIPSLTDSEPGFLDGTPQVLPTTERNGRRAQAQVHIDEALRSADAASPPPATQANTQQSSPPPIASSSFAAANADQSPISPQPPAQLLTNAVETSNTDDEDDWTPDTDRELFGYPEELAAIGPQISNDSLPDYEDDEGFDDLEERVDVQEGEPLTPISPPSTLALPPCPAGSFVGLSGSLRGQQDFGDVDGDADDEDEGVGGMDDDGEEGLDGVAPLDDMTENDEQRRMFAPQPFDEDLEQEIEFDDEAQETVEVPPIASAALTLEVIVQRDEERREAEGSLEGHLEQEIDFDEEEDWQLANEGGGAKEYRDYSDF